jgi:hypothetical protein
MKSSGQINTRKKHNRRRSSSRKEAAMTDTPYPQEMSDSTDILQAPWLHQSYLIGHPLEQKERYAEA